MEIEEQPRRPTFCSQCIGSITWLYSAARKAWLPFVVSRSDRNTISLCRHAPTADLPHWKRVTPQPLEVLEAGVERARAVLTKSSTEKETP
jgi:hypothetical protein